MGDIPDDVRKLSLARPQMKSGSNVPDTRGNALQHPVAPTAQSGLQRFLQNHGPVLAALWLLQFVAYMYLFTTPIFTNHTFPGVQVHPYPSYKTVNEGRWLADLVCWLQGGSGVSPLLMSAATFLQAVNGVLLARLIGLTRRGDIFLVGAVLALNPAFVDYYSFTVDLFYFVLADFLAVIGVLVWRSGRTSWVHAAVSCGLFVAAIACYQPKVALIGFMVLTSLLVDASMPEAAGHGSLAAGRRSAHGYAVLIMTIVTSCLVYLAASRLSLRQDAGGMRTYTNTLSEAWEAGLASYGQVATRLLLRADYLPSVFTWLPSVLVTLGLLVILVRGRKSAVRNTLIVLLACGLAPLALDAPYIVNKNSWAGAGRIIAADAYAVSFFAGCLLMTRPTRGLARIGLATLCGGLLVTASQQSNAAAFKTVYELNMMNRILLRTEPLLQAAGGPPRALVIVGKQPEFPWTRFVRSSPRPGTIHLRYDTLAVYRQVETLNYLAGWNAFRSPTSLEVETAAQSMQGRPSWPTEGSVYLHDETVCVVLQPYQPSLPRTWSVDDYR